MRWCPWRSVILTWLAASTVMEMAQRHQSYSLQWDQRSTWPLRLSMPGLASPSLTIRDATCGVSALFCKYLYFNGPYRSMIFFAVKLCVHCYVKKYKHWLLNWACTVQSLSWFFSPTVWACTCLLLSFKCRNLFLCLTPIPFQSGWCFMLRKTTGWRLVLILMIIFVRTGTSCCVATHHSMASVGRSAAGTVGKLVKTARRCFSTASRMVTTSSLPWSGAASLHLPRIWSDTCWCVSLANATQQLMFWSTPGFATRQLPLPWLHPTYSPGKKGICVCLCVFCPPCV